jgi:hypothetical protein
MRKDLFNASPRKPVIGSNKKPVAPGTPVQSTPPARPTKTLPPTPQSPPPRRKGATASSRFVGDPPPFSLSNHSPARPTSSAQPPDTPKRVDASPARVSPIQGLLNGIRSTGDLNPLIQWLDRSWLQPSDIDALHQLSDPDLRAMLQVCVDTGFSGFDRRVLLLHAFHVLALLPGAARLRPDYEEAIQRFFGAHAANIVSTNRNLAHLIELRCTEAAMHCLEPCISAPYLDAYRTLFHGNPAAMARQGTGAGLRFTRLKDDWSSAEIEALERVCDTWNEAGGETIGVALALVQAVTAELPAQEQHLPLLRQCLSLRERLQPGADTSLSAASARKRSALFWLAVNPTLDTTGRIVAFAPQLIGRPQNSPLAREMLLDWVHSELLNPLGASWEALKAVLETADTPSLQLDLRQNYLLWLDLACMELRRGNGLPLKALLEKLEKGWLDEDTLLKVLDAWSSQPALKPAERADLLKLVIPLLPAHPSGQRAHATCSRAMGQLSDMELFADVQRCYLHNHGPQDKGA